MNNDYIIIEECDAISLMVIIKRQNLKIKKRKQKYSS